MKRLVIKFGGTSLMDTRRMQKAAEIIMAAKASGVEVVAVVSAMGHTTDHLIALSEDISKDGNSAPDQRELDLLMTTGEQVSACLMTIAIQSLGGCAQSFTGQTAGITTDDHFGNAKIKTIHKERLERTLTKGIIPVVAGFQGISEKGEITTLGRGGSDITAIALAAVLHAECCDIYSDVRGVYSADPNVLSRAYRLDAISYSDMLELAKNGAQILNDRSVQIAWEQKVKVRVRSTFLPEDTGTLVTEKAKQINPFTSIACSTKEDCVKVHVSPAYYQTLINKPLKRHDCTESRRLLLKLLVQQGITAETGSSLKSGLNVISFSVSKADSEKAVDILRKTLPNSTLESELPGPPVQSVLSVQFVELEQNLVKLSVVGPNLDSAFEAEAILKLTKELIPISTITRGKNRLSLFVPEAYKHEALRVLHANCCVPAGSAA